MALGLTIIAALLFAVVAFIVPCVLIRRGQGVKYVYGNYPPDPGTPVIQGEVVDDPDTAFFDEHDLAVMEAKEERPEFVRTEILVNGIRANADGIVPSEGRESWWRR